MGRPSKLSDAQWAEIGRRLAKGEGVSALAREYGVGKARVSERFSERTGTIKALARKVADVEAELQTYSVPEQGIIRSLADDLKITSTNLATLARLNSTTAKHLSGLANVRAMKLTVGEGTPLDREALIEVINLTTASNKAAVVPMELLAMTRNGGALADDPEDDGGPRKIILINDPDAP